MDKLEWLLTDEFIAYAHKIEEIHNEKKAKKQELKDFYEKIMADLKGLEADARQVQKDFDDWKNKVDQEMKKDAG
jgi:hypothetical protein